MNPNEDSFRVVAVLLGTLLISCLTSCATSSNAVIKPATSNDNSLPPIEAQSTNTALEIPVVMRTADGNEVPVDARPSDLTLLIGAVTGSIVGKPGRYVSSLRIGRARSFTLDLAWLGGQSAQAVAIDRHFDRALSSSVKISPVATRFARLATLTSSKNRYLSSFVQFADSETRDSLLLVYFDRPCRLSGTVVTQEGRAMATSDYAVTIDSAGWAWLSVKEVGPSHYSITRATMPHAALVITEFR